MVSCFHCGLPVPRGGRHAAAVLGEARAFCCAGCEAVARTIVASGFEKYYETRTSLGAAPAPLASEPSRFEDAKGEEAALILDRVRCSACLWLIEQTLRRAPGVLRADVNYATRRAHVTWDKAQTGLARIISAVRAVGYEAYPYEPGRQQAVERRERRSALWRLFVAGFGAMQVMMYAFPAYLDGGAGELSADAERLMRWVSLVLTLPVVLFACRPFFDGAWQELRNRRLGLDTPIALGIAGGFLASAWATVTGTGEVYFDSISMLVFLLLATRYAEAAARRRAVAALDPLLRPQNERKLAVDEVVLVAPGERVPADGLVESGVSSADESLITGESRPVTKRPGDELVGGSVNLEQPLGMRVTRVGADARAGIIARLVERAVASRPALVETADRAARVLTHVVVAAALLMYLLTQDPWIPVAILVATCPCALALAAPIVLTRAGTALLGSGVLLTRSRALETLERATDVVLDKTGTLTAGRTTISHFSTLGAQSLESCLALAGALEKSSRHPIARAFDRHARLEAHSVRCVPGEGVEGSIGGRLLRIGSQTFCAALCGLDVPAFEDRPGARRPSSRVYLASERGWLAAFELEDELRPGAAALIRGLEEKNIRVHLCSGDREQVVAAVAGELGIGQFRGGMLPQDKLAYVERLQAEGRIVAMVGDGLNDTPVLARADVSVAMGSGADVAQLKADAVLLSSRLSSLGSLLDTARRAMRLVRQNLMWAGIYNAAVLPLAAVGWIGPWEAALGMGGSSLVVLFNALRALSPESRWKASTSSSPCPSPSYS